MALPRRPVRGSTAEPTAESKQARAALVTRLESVARNAPRPLTLSLTGDAHVHLIAKSGPEVVFQTAGEHDAVVSRFFEWVRGLKR